MTFAKSKLISSSPDYFIFGVTDSSGKLRESVTTPTSMGVGNYGHVYLYGV